MKKINALRYLSFLLITTFLVSCNEKPSSKTPEVPRRPEIVSISGGAISVIAQDSPLWLTTQEILDDTDNPVVDGTQFVVNGSAEIQVSVDGLNYADKITLSSKDGVIKFATKPPTQAGTYKVQVTQTQKQSKNANGFFYIDVKPSTPDFLGSIVSDRFEDTAPYNETKDANEKYSVLADGQSPMNFTVGPIVDQFGNTLDKGFIRLIVDKGQIVSTNPASISDGFAVFSFLPTTQDTAINVKAQAVDEANGVILRETVGIIYQVKPKLVLQVDEDYGDLLINTSKEIKAVLRNEGTTYAQDIAIKTMTPFSAPSSSSECQGTLHPGQSCEITVMMSFQDSGAKGGTISIQGQPSIIPENKTVATVKIRAINPASIVVSSPSVSFDTACGESIEKEFYVQNVGDIDANNFQVIDPQAFNQQEESTCNSGSSSSSTCSTLAKCRWKDSNPSASKCTSNPFDLTYSPASAIVGDSAFCGSTIPAGGLKCKVRVKFSPKELIGSQVATARVQADNIAPITVNLISNARVGEPFGTFPISFNKNEVAVSSLDTAQITVGPVTDKCGNRLTNSTSFTASVSAGSLSSSSGTFADGQASLIWYGANNHESIGTQSVTVKTGNITSQGNVLFTGVKIAISGSSDVGEVNADGPQQKSWTVTNTGNKSTSLTAVIKNQLNINVTDIDVSACQSLAPNSSCQVKVLMVPLIPTSKGTVSFSGELEVTAAGQGKNVDSFSFKGTGTKIINLAQDKILDYDLGTAPAGNVPTRVITFKNDSASSSSAITIGYEGNPPYWETSNNNCSSVAAGQTCSLTIAYSNSDKTIGDKISKLIVNTGIGKTTINFKLSLTGDVDKITELPMSVVVESGTSQTSGQSRMAGPSTASPGTGISVPADGVSSAVIQIGPIKDLNGNPAPAGTKIFVTTDKGVLVESQPVLTDSSGIAKVTLLSVSGQVGTATVRASFNNVAGFINVTFTGVDLNFAESSLDFGELAMGLSLDKKIVFRNVGNMDASDLSFESSDSSMFTISDIGTCQSGSLSFAGNSQGKPYECEILIRFTSPAGLIKQNISEKITVRSSTPAGKNVAELEVKAVNLVPSTLMAEKRQFTVQLIPGRIVVSELILMNLGDDAIKNFTIQTDSSNYISLTDFDDCKNLAGGASCSVTVTFNPKEINSAFAALITASGSDTSTQIAFSADKVNLAYSNPNFSADAFTCHPIKIQSQDSNGNPMELQEAVLVNISTNKSGAFYRSKTCAGPTVSRTNIFAGRTETEQLYFIPRVAGKHTLRARLDDSINGAVETYQDNLAKIVMSPGTQLNVAPLGPVELTALGAVGNVKCSFTSNASDSETLTAAGKVCYYKAGLKGNVSDFIILSDDDVPANTAAIKISTGQVIQIAPTIVTLSSAGTNEFSAKDGSGVGYSYSTRPSTSLKRIGSSMSGNIFTAGQNITGKDFTQYVTVKDSLGAESRATVLIKPSIFTEKEILMDGAAAMKSIAAWKDTIVVGDPQATVDGIVGAGHVHIYRYNAVTSQWLKTSSARSLKPIANGNFGKSVSIFRDKIIVGAPGETPYSGLLDGGNAYLMTITDTGTLATVESVIKAAGSSDVKTGSRWGELVSITDGFFAVKEKTGVHIYDMSDYKKTRQGCNNAPCTEKMFEEGISSISIYNNVMYDGAFLAVGINSEVYDRKENAGVVWVYKRTKLQDNDVIWELAMQRLVASDAGQGHLFGSSVSLYGPYVAIGAPGANGGKGAVYIYKRRFFNSENQNLWENEQKFSASEFNPEGNTEGMAFGSSVTIQGNYLAIGSAGQKNYPYDVYDKSGSMYMFQRYLSEDNKWEFLGQVRSTEYMANDQYGLHTAVYENNFFSTDARGRAYSVTGGKSENTWPFGYHGDYRLMSGQTLNFSGDNPYRDYSSVRVDSGAKIFNHGSNNPNGWMYWGVAGEMVFNGYASGESTEDWMTNSVATIDPDGYPNFSKTVSHRWWRGNGGSGGRSVACKRERRKRVRCGWRIKCKRWYEDYWACKGSWPNQWPGGVCGNGGGGTGDWWNSHGGASCSAGGRGGTGGAGHSQWSTGYGATTYGGTGGHGTNHPGWGGGGGGGFRGKHGSLFYIVAGKFSGNGTIDVAGKPGGTGGHGGWGDSVDWSRGDICTQERCTIKPGIKKPKNKADLNCTCLNWRTIYGGAHRNLSSGAGGGGGGGAGGTGGQVIIKTKDKAGSLYDPDNLFASGGPGGPGGQTYCRPEGYSIVGGSQCFTTGEVSMTHCNLAESCVSSTPGSSCSSYLSIQPCTINKVSQMCYFFRAVKQPIRWVHGWWGHFTAYPGGYGSSGAAGKTCFNCQ